MGPFLEYATQKPADPIELRIYPGADAQFVLYEDENDNYNYEKGVYATIPIRWNEARQELTFGKRQGRFPGMIEEREFRIVWVGKSRGTAVEDTQQPDVVLWYAGTSVVATRPRIQ